MNIMPTRTICAASATAILAALCGCSKGGEPSSAAPVAAPPSPAVAAASAAPQNSCKDFPAPLYPSTTSAFCEQIPQRESNPLHYTAYLKSGDSVEQVTRYYQTQLPAAEWTPKPAEGQTPEHAVVVLEKGKAYASIVINPGAGGSGSSFQVNAYPNGNDLN